MKHFVKHLAAVAMVAAALPAHAAVLDYELTGQHTASWQIDTSRQPDDTRADLFGYYSVPVTVDGIQHDNAMVFFFGSWALGGAEVDLGLDPNGAGVDTLFSAVSLDPYAFNMGQLFTGTTDDPVLIAGEWDFWEYADFPANANDAPSYHLSVTQVTGAVPEPTSWALMIAGFGLVGGAVRRAKGVRMRPAFGG